MLSTLTHINMHALTFLYTETHVYAFQVDLIFDSLPQINLNKFVIAEFFLSTHIWAMANKPL